MILCITKPNPLDVSVALASHCASFVLTAVVSQQPFLNFFSSISSIFYLCSVQSSVLSSDGVSVMYVVAHNVIVCFSRRAQMRSDGSVSKF